MHCNNHQLINVVKVKYFFNGLKYLNETFYIVFCTTEFQHMILFESMHIFFAN